MCALRLGCSRRYERVLVRLAEIAKKREDERNKFKLEAEHRRVSTCVHQMSLFWS